jgi:hypothetical protein
MKPHDVSNTGNVTGSVIYTPVCGSVVSHHAVREGNVPGEYVVLQQQRRMIRPGRMLL